IGEKHVRPDEYGTQASGDQSIYSDDSPQPIGRVAGRHFPLAQSPDSDLGNNRLYQFGGVHSGICQFVLGDGHVASIAVSTDTDVLRRLAHRSDGETIAEEL